MERTEYLLPLRLQPATAQWLEAVANSYGLGMTECVTEMIEEAWMQCLDEQVLLAATAPDLSPPDLTQTICGVVDVDAMSDSNPLHRPDDSTLDFGALPPAPRPR